MVKVDESTATAAQLCKLYGIMARKGDSTPERPHRRSSLLASPERIDPVSQEALEALAAEVATAPTPATAARPTPSACHDFDIDLWLGQSGLEIFGGPDPYNGGRRWTLRACSFNPEHQKPVIIELVYRFNKT